MTNGSQATPREPYDVSLVTRIEIIDQHSRVFSRSNLSRVEIMLQDDGRTMKVFCKDEKAGTV